MRARNHLPQSPFSDWQDQQKDFTRALDVAAPDSWLTGDCGSRKKPPSSGTLRSVGQPRWEQICQTQRGPSATLSPQLHHVHLELWDPMPGVVGSSLLRHMLGACWRSPRWGSPHHLIHSNVALQHWRAFREVSIFTSYTRHPVWFAGEFCCMQSRNLLPNGNTMKS